MSFFKSSRKTILVIVAVVFVVALAEFFMGRGWWCPAKDLLPWSFDITSIHNSQHLADPYSLTHISHGLLFFIIIAWLFRKKNWNFGTKIFIAIVVESIWEIIENSSFIIDRFRESAVSLGYYGDSITNSLSDIVFMAFGFWIASKIRARYALIIVLAFEIICYLWVRDNLILEIVQLVHPLK